MFFFVLGEPIMYPRINELVRILHGHEISTFLVTNAQFPDAIRWAFFLLNFVLPFVLFREQCNFIHDTPFLQV